MASSAAVMGSPGMMRRMATANLKAGRLSKQTAYALCELSLDCHSFRLSITELGLQACFRHALGFLYLSQLILQLQPSSSKAAFFMPRTKSDKALRVKARQHYHQCLSLEPVQLADQHVS